MKQSFTILIAAAAVASIVAAAGIASAANTALEASCHAAIAENLTKYQATLAKSLAGCHRSRSAGKIPSATACNTAAGADLKGGRATTRDAIGAAINTACADPSLSAMLASNYPRCPSPVATSDDGGATTGIDTYAELAICLLDLSEVYISRIGETVLGNPTMPLSADTTQAKQQTRCQHTLGKAVTALVRVAGKKRSKCQTDQEKPLTNQEGIDYLTCSGSAGDSKMTISKTIVRLETAIDKGCGLASKTTLNVLGACADSASELKDCVIDRALAPTADGLVAAVFEFPNDGMGNLTCAPSADVIINAGYGDKLTDSRLDFGFTGLAHGIDVVDGARGGVSLENCNADCENCEVHLDPTSDYCRCDNDSSITCNTIEGPDAACGGNTCHCMFGPPLAISSGGTPVCVVNHFSEDLDGTTGVIGTYDVTMRTRALVHAALDQLRPCPTCEADACVGGPRHGLACSVDATHPDFGPTSFDCQPLIGANVSGAGLSQTLQFTSGSVGFTAGVANPVTCEAGTCHCGQCSGDALVGCSNDGECAALGAGVCGTVAPVTNLSRENSCDTGVAECSADSANPGMGKCDSGPNDYFCDGAVRQNGGGILPCGNDGDCAVLNPICNGGNCGTCTIITQRSCFLPAISATGTPGIFNSEGVSAFCSAQTLDAVVNQAFGLPGPGRVKLDFDFIFYCDENVAPGTIFELPGGSNCLY